MRTSLALSPDLSAETSESSQGQIPKSNRELFRERQATLEAKNAIEESALSRIANFEASDLLKIELFHKAMLTGTEAVLVTGELHATTNQEPCIHNPHFPITSSSKIPQAFLDRAIELNNVDLFRDLLKLDYRPKEAAGDKLLPEVMFFEFDELLRENAEWLIEKITEQESRKVDEIIEGEADLIELIELISHKTDPVARIQAAKDAADKTTGTR